MTLENPGLSRRKLLRTTAIGVPAAGLLAFGSTLVTAPSANALQVDGIWGEGTTVALQQFLNQALGAGLEVDGLIGSQPASAQEELAVFGSGWDWVSDSDASGSATITAMQNWLGVSADGLIGRQTFSALGRYEDPELGRAIDELTRELDELTRELDEIDERYDEASREEQQRRYEEEEEYRRQYEEASNDLKNLYREVVRLLQEMLDKLLGNPDPEARKWFEEHR